MTSDYELPLGLRRNSASLRNREQARKNRDHSDLGFLIFKKHTR